MTDFPYLQPGTLFPKAIATAAAALATGALQPIATDCEEIEAGNIRFLVRILANFRRKQAANRAQARKAINPFLPYERDLFVADLSPSHLCLLNKFNAVDHHLLMVTRTFQSQEDWLKLEDFEAAAICLREIDGLVFYNGGTLAGASQPHKHLQLIPLPIGDRDRLPLDPAIAAVSFQKGIGRLPDYGFAHALSPIGEIWSLELSEVAAALLGCYRELLQAVGLNIIGDRQTAAYNLLLTRDWMMAISRSQASFQGIEVNALGFAGALLVRDRDRLLQLKSITPLALLHAVAQKL